MKHTLIRVLLCTLTFVAAGCSHSDDNPTVPQNEWTEIRVAVVLPMEKGLDAHWQRTLGMFQANFERAFKNQPHGLRIKFDLFDESRSDIRQIANELAADEGIYAVIGGLYSSTAEVLASELTRAGKTFFTLATAERLVRAYASTGCLWAMTETDITQCEVLLSKAANYGAGSVALLAKDDDGYGRTFIDWFSFQSKELGLVNKGVFAYNVSDLSEKSRQALSSGADYLICIPSEVEDIGPIISAVQAASATRAKLPRILFSDTAYGYDVLETYGSSAEGIEGVAFGADPESGFDVSYRTLFGTLPTLGEAQVYDAAMLTGYAAWLRTLNPDISLRDALRSVVTGEDMNMGSWREEDMRLVIDAIARGDAPDVRGASGSLQFDTKVFTNVLATTYYNFKVYNGQYIILDYNTSDGGNRTDATLAGWNWKASQMQDFGNQGELSYPPLKSN